MASTCRARRRMVRRSADSVISHRSPATSPVVGPARGQQDLLSEPCHSASRSPGPVHVIVEEFINAAVLIAAVTVLIITHHRRAPKIHWIAYVPVGCRPSLRRPVGRHTVRIPSRLVSHHAALSVALFLLDRPVLTWSVFCFAVVAGVVASFSSFRDSSSGRSGWLSCCNEHEPGRSYSVALRPSGDGRPLLLQLEHAGERWFRLRTDAIRL